MRRGLLALVVAALISGVMPSASAKDQRACVSLREFRNANGGFSPYVDQPLNHKIATRAQQEIRWEVRGLGRIVPGATDNIYTVRNYPACGYSRHEAGVWVYYFHDRKTFAHLRWVKRDATLHGQERQEAS